MKSLSLRKKLWLLMLLMGIAASFGALSVWDTLQGKQGVEDLFFSIPMLLGGLTTVVLLALQLARQQGQRAADLSPPDPGEDAQRARRIRKLALATALPTVTLLIGLYTVTWSVRSGTVWTPVLIGAIVLAVAWIVMLVIFRPRAQR
jgi:ABC-type uncharacterized transport system YnjBCD permease subunit